MVCYKQDSTTDVSHRLDLSNRMNKIIEPNEQDENIGSVLAKSGEIISI